MSDKSLEGNLEFLRDVKYLLDLHQTTTSRRKTNPLICLLVIRNVTFESLQYFDFFFQIVNQEKKSLKVSAYRCVVCVCVLLTWRLAPVGKSSHTEMLLAFISLDIEQLNAVKC